MGLQAYSLSFPTRHCLNWMAQPITGDGKTTKRTGMVSRAPRPSPTTLEAGKMIRCMDTANRCCLTARTTMEGGKGT